MSAFPGYNDSRMRQSNLPAFFGQGAPLGSLLPGREHALAGDNVRPASVNELLQRQSGLPPATNNISFANNNSDRVQLPYFNFSLPPVNPQMAAPAPAPIPGGQANGAIPNPMFASSQAPPPYSMLGFALRQAQAQAQAHAQAHSLTRTRTGTGKDRRFR
eukprot:comp19427_c0_seq1/m.22528 comp19427_c0_seq1/g.22528  ORF comp19427_c0_seq1/g.22528 comp19427_c0_seq1/m.22528 type:complete len:160 (-) comp19427_c0_seq1:795-1274(-)